MGYDTGNYGGVIYVCPHTGESFMGRDLAQAKAQALSCSPNCEGTAAFATDPLSGKRVLETSLVSPISGVYQGAQTGTQVRVQANTLGLYDTSLPDINTFGIADVQAEAYKIFQHQAMKDAGVYYATPVNSPGSTNEPAYATGLNTDASINAGETLGSQNRAGVGTTGVGGVSGILDKVTAAPLALIAIIGVGLLLIYMMGKGLTGSAVR